MVLGVADLKIFAFGPRPEDFYACNAPIKPLYDLGLEVMENSELDLLHLYNAVDENDREVTATAKDMAKELGEGNTYPKLLPKMARFEVALTAVLRREPGQPRSSVCSRTSAGRPSRRPSASRRAT